MWSYEIFNEDNFLKKIVRHRTRWLLNCCLCVNYHGWKKTHTFGTIPKSNIRLVDRGKHLTRKYMTIWGSSYDLFQQTTIVILMGTNCALLLDDLFPYSYETDLITLNRINDIVKSIWSYEIFNEDNFLKKIVRHRTRWQLNCCLCVNCHG